MLYFPILASLLALFFAYFLAQGRRSLEIDKESQSDARQSVRQETRTFLKRQYWAVGKWTVFLFFIFLVGLGWKEAGGFLLGVIFSGANALIGFLILGKEKNPGFSFRSFKYSRRLFFRRFGAVGRFSLLFFIRRAKAPYCIGDWFFLVFSFSSLRERCPFFLLIFLRPMY